MLAAKRLRKRAAVFVAFGAVSLVVSALGAGINGYLAHAETAAVRAELDSRAGSDLALETSLALASNSDEQDAQMRELVARELSPSLSVTRTVSSKLPAENSGGSTLVLLSIADLAEVATLVDGQWPGSPDEVAVQADAASALGLRVGMPLQLGPRSATVAATWRAVDPLAGRWLGDRLIADGVDGADAGPVVIDESLWGSLGASPRVRWAITANRTTMSPAELESIRTGWEAFPATIRAENTVYDVSFGHRGLLGAVAGEILTRIESLRAIVPVALLTIGAIALLTIIELARLLVTLRSTEYRLMWSRGATARSLAIAAAGETALVAIPGAVVGVVLASGALILALDDPAAPARASAWILVTPLVVSALVTALVAATTWTAGRALESRDAAVRSPRPRRLVGVGALVLVLLAATLSTWQLLLYGSPITVSASGRAQVDPVAVSAPALLLVSAVLLALALVTALAPAVHRWSEASRGVRVALVSRTMLRRLRFTVIPLVLCALVSGQLLIAASYSATWDASFTQSRELRTGSTLSLSGGRLAEGVIQQAAAVPGVSGVAPITVQNTPVGIEQASLVAADPNAVSSLVATGNGLVDAEVIASAIRSVPVGTPLTSDHLTIETTVTGLTAAPPIAALLTDDLGGLHTVPLEPATGATAYSGVATAGWRLIGFDIELPPDVGGDEPPTIMITGGSIDLTIPWAAFALSGLNWELPRIGSAVGFTFLQGGVVRIVAQARAASAIPIAVSQQFADRTGVAVGDTLPIVIDSRQDAVVTTVAAIVPAIPGAEREFAAMIDLATVQRAALGLYDSHPMATQAWVRSATPNESADALRAALPARVGVTSLQNDQARTILGSAATALWIGAVGAAVLGLLALLTVVRAQLSSRRAEVGLLRALGLSAATTASARRIELAISAAAGVVVGLLAGLVVTVLTVPALARAAVPDVFLSVPTPPAVAVLPLAMSLGLFLVCLGAIVLSYGAAVSRQAHRVSAREEGE